MSARHYVDPDPAWNWLDRIRVGDVIKVGKSYRVVREAHYRSSGLLYSVTCTIMHCSWTRRCYTIITRSDLKTKRAEKVGVRVKLDRPIDTKILLAIGAKGKPKLTCCDVRGIL